MKILTMHDAIAQYVHDGETIAIEGFTAFICFSAAYEIIRQGRRDLTLCRMTPDMIYDQMIAAGCARKLVFSYMGNPGVGPLFCIRRAVEQGVPKPLEIEEYSHFGTICRYAAGAARLPFFPLRSYVGDDLAKVNPGIKFVENPYGEGRIAVVARRSDVYHAKDAIARGPTMQSAAPGGLTLPVIGRSKHRFRVLVYAM